MTQNDRPTTVDAGPASASDGPQPDGDSGERTAGLRERNKRRKERAIRDAARTLFVEHGYEATSLRAVAKLADVGFGTVFAYANDKAGLLAMVYVEALKALPPLFPVLDPPAPLMDELVGGLAHLYEFWATIPALSGHVLQQMEFYGRNPHMDVILDRRRQARQELAAWLARVRDDGRVRAETDPEAAADTLFAIYTSAVREWSATDPDDVAAGLDRLTRLMALAVRGLGQIEPDAAGRR